MIYETHTSCLFYFSSVDLQEKNTFIYIIKGKVTSNSYTVHIQKSKKKNYATPANKQTNPIYPHH